MQPNVASAIRENRGELVMEEAAGKSEKTSSEISGVVRPGERIETPIPCPECGGLTEIVIEEWENETGRPIKSGFRLICSQEERGFEFDCRNENRHFYWLSVWLTSIDDAYIWMIKAGIRIATENTD